jgi:hypothetical protein
MLAVDVSVYSGEITADKWREIKALGYEVAVIGLFHGQTANRFANQQGFAAREAGMISAGYIYLAPWTGKNGEEQVLTGLQTLGAGLAKDLNFVAIDCECDGISKEMIWDAVATVRSEGLRAAIYTARWWWKDHFGDPHDFAGVPLWSAYYDNDPDLDFPKMPYGNWAPELRVGVRAAQTTGIMGEQYAGTVYICGVNCDLNFFDERFIRQEEEDMALKVHALVKKTGEDAIYLASLTTGTLTHVPSPPIAAVFDLPLGTEVQELPPGHDIWTWSILEPR